MGQPITKTSLDAAQRGVFVKKVLADLNALEHMIRAGMFECQTRRIGAEQELVLVDSSWRPAPMALQVLERLADPRFTTELSIYNLEFNATPLEFGGDCLRRMEQDLSHAVALVEEQAAEFGARPILTGILPTLRKSDLTLDSVTPEPRYLSLAEALRSQRGEAYEFRFTGTDELIMRHDSVMLEACNTSSQFHFQVAPDEFPTLFNAAQAVAGPALAVAVNSPLLFGKRLWRETRIALFQQSIDTRRPIHAVEQRSARVRFGEGWVKDSVLELYQEDISRFPVLLTDAIDEDPFRTLDAGEVPKLRALQLHNSTVYRWNRVCYGITDGRPHLRIENRLFPAGPTVTDEVANAAFWFGLIAGVVARHGDVAAVMDFDDAKSNFLLASRLGLDVRMSWLHGTTHEAPALIEDELLPLAREGLATCGIDTRDIDHYLGIIAERTRSRKTGARWLLDSFQRALKPGRTPIQRLDALVALTWARQQEGRPVHEWDAPDEQESDRLIEAYRRVDHFMTTDVFTVRDDDVIDLAAAIMDWKHVRHVPVENANRELVGLISYRQLLRFLARDLPHDRTRPVPVRDVMRPSPITVAPDTPTLEAMELMRHEHVPCLPVVKEKRLVGIITERDFIPVAARLLQDRLTHDTPADDGV